MQKLKLAVYFTIRNRVSYNKQLTDLARSETYWEILVVV